MKHINFIKTLSAKEHRSIKAWYISSLFLGLWCIGGLTVLSIHKYLLLNNLEKEMAHLSKKISSFESVIFAKQERKKKETEIKNQLNLITQAHRSMQEYANLMLSVKKSLKKWGNLESLTIDPHTITLAINCSQAQYVNHIIAALEKIPGIQEIHLNSLRPKQQGNTTCLCLNVQGMRKQISE